jgi:hypothetical protein
MGLDDPSEINFNKTIAKNRVSTIYNYRTCDKTWDLIESLQEGKALFTQPFGPVKCAGGASLVADRAAVSEKRGLKQSNLLSLVNLSASKNQLHGLG